MQYCGKRGAHLRTCTDRPFAARLAESEFAAPGAVSRCARLDGYVNHYIPHIFMSLWKQVSYVFRRAVLHHNQPVSNGQPANPRLNVNLMRLNSSILQKFLTKLTKHSKKHITLNSTVKT